MVLFYCASVYHIFNAVNIKRTLHPAEDADMLLGDYTDLSKYVQPLLQSGLFRSVQIVRYTEVWRQYNGLPLEEKAAFAKNPGKYTPGVAFKGEYTDYYCFICTLYDKLLYYKMVKEGMRPKVHISEEGLSVYVTDLMEKSATGPWDERYYGGKAFRQNVAELLFYEPELCVVDMGLPINTLPKLRRDDAATVETYVKIFGQPTFFEEPYIFFEEAFFHDNMLSSDRLLMRQVVERLGIAKEELVIKLHPRNKVDFWSQYGFKTMGVSDVPWEMAMLCFDTGDKVSFTVSSSAALSPRIIFGDAMRTFYLYRLMEVGENAHVRQEHFGRFVAAAKQLFNRDEMQFYVPSRMDILAEEMKYIRGY